MTRFVGVRNMVRWAGARGPQAIISEMIAYLEEDFGRWEQFERTPRIANHTPYGVIELMPTTDFERYAFKYVNGHPSNPARGFQTVTAFGVLADMHTGYPTLLAEMTLLTALRTAATSAMVARRLARPASQVMGIIGAGSQAEFQALGMRAALGIERLKIWDVDAAAMQKFTRNLEPLGFDIQITRSGHDAVAGADVVTTCTADKAAATVLTDEMVEPGMHINAIGGDCPGKTELDPAILDRSKVYVEFAPQTRIEGEIQQRLSSFPVTEVWEVIAGRAAGRSRVDEVTVFDSVGFAIEDFAALRYLADQVAGTDLEEEIDLVAEPEDPKDLFGMIGALSPAI